MNKYVNNVLSMTNIGKKHSSTPRCLGSKLDCQWQEPHIKCPIETFSLSKDSAHSLDDNGSNANDKELAHQRKLFYFAFIVFIASFCLGSVIFSLFSRSHCNHYYTNKCQKSDAHKSECREMVDRNNGSIFEIHNGYHLNLSAKNEGIFGKIRSSQFNLCFTCICHAMNLTCSWPCPTDTSRCAYFLMKEGFYVDCIREAVDINITLGISRCEKNRNCALKCVENYWMRYAENCSRDLTDFCKTVTRIVWAGPRCVAEKESLKAATEQAVANVSQCYNEGIKYDFLE